MSVISSDFICRGRQNNENVIRLPKCLRAIIEFSVQFNWFPLFNARYRTFWRLVYLQADGFGKFSGADVGMRELSYPSVFPDGTFRKRSVSWNALPTFLNWVLSPILLYRLSNLRYRGVTVVSRSRVQIINL